MPTSAKKIIAQAFGKLGMRAAGQAIPGEDEDVAFEALNVMLDAMRIERMLAYATATVSTTLGAGSNSLTIGPGQQLNIAVRPVRFEAGCHIVFGGISYPLTEITRANYNDISLPVVTGGIPDCFYYDTAFPAGIIYFSPAAGSAMLVNMIVTVELSAFTDLDANYALPPGYEDFLVYELSQHIAPDFEREVPPSVAAKRISLRRKLKAANHVVEELTADVSGLSDRQVFYGGY